MFGPRLFNGLSFTRVLGGLSRTLGVVNQIIPLYKEAKPLMNNARNAFNIIKEFSNSTTNKVLTNTEKNLQPLKEKINQTTNTFTKFNHTKRSYFLSIRPFKR